MTTSQYVLRHDMISFMEPGKSTPTMMRSDQPAFNSVVDAVKKKDWAAVTELLNPLKAFCDRQDGRLHIVDSSLYFDNVEVHTSLSSKIVEMIKRNEDPSKFIRFMENLLQNPDDRAIMELYGFVDKNTLPITNDGYLLAYKSVRLDFYDHYSKSVHYLPGNSPEMNREDVCSDPNKTCSAGLHVCSINYLKNQLFGGDHKSRIVLVKVNPRDIVSVPVDYENSKVRCCKLTVVTEFFVRSGNELAKIDNAIQKNLDAFTKNVSMDEAELRELIGMQDEENPLDKFGKAGDLVSFYHKEKHKAGHLFGVVKPAQPASIVLQNIEQSVAVFFGERLKSISDKSIQIGFANELLVKGNKNISLNNRLVIVRPHKAVINGKKMNFFSKDDFDLAEQFMFNHSVNVVNFVFKVYLIDEDEVTFIDPSLLPPKMGAGQTQLTDGKLVW
jgi:hypothetical protein